jgi:hypothetical protein
MRSSLGDDEDQGDDVAVTCAALDDVRAACPFGRQCGVLTVTTGQPDIWADLGTDTGYVHCSATSSRDAGRGHTENSMWTRADMWT